ncbi:MAG: glycosyltransferase family 2 protein [Synergistaceae bacterium]|nr:glycosyltransferase family 2 protein [Synergistaceae bacterium]
MADLKKISVIIPAYNAERFINKCVESLLNQSYKNVEIVIVINGSQDATPQICEELAAKYNNIKLVKLNPNQGTNWARRAGFEASSGEYITLCDSDDYLDANAYEKAIKVLEENNLDIVQFGVNLVTPEGKLLSQDKPEQMKLNNSRDNFFYALTLAGALWNKVYKRSVFENVEWPKLTHFEDTPMTIQLLAHAKNFMSISEPFYYWVQNPGSGSHRPDMSKFKTDAETSTSFMVDFTRKNFPEFLPEILWRRLLIIERVFMDYAAASEHEEPNRRENLKSLNQEIRKIYAEFNAALKEQNSTISDRPTLNGRQVILDKMRAKTFVFAHFPRAAVLYSKLRFKIRELTER